MIREAFEMFSHRPEYLQSLLSDLENSPGFDPRTIDSSFVVSAAESLERTHQSFLGSVRSMDVLDAAVLRRMARLGEAFTPFDAQALDDYQLLMQKANPQAKASRPTKSSVQGALERLRKEALVWNAGRGLWYIEDSQHVAWLRSDDGAAAADAAAD